MKQFNFLAEDNRLERLSKMGDPLEKISKVIDFEIFRPILEKTLRNPEKDPSKGGRPPFDVILMWKMALLGMWYGLGTNIIEFMVNDRLTFQRFLGIGLGDKVPDSNTLWDFKNALALGGVDRQLFDMFTEKMEKMGIITRKGSIVDATFVDAPRQRNTYEENEIIKGGNIPEEWEKPENKHKLSQKDTDARWAKKGDETHFGYKDHVKVDDSSKMIVDFSVTHAAVHDSQEFVNLIDEKDNVVSADAAYVGEDFKKQIHEKCGKKVDLKINEKGYRNKPLTDEQKAENREKSKVRSRVEHVFGFMTVSMGGIIVRTIGLSRAKAEIARRNLAYNLKRYVFLASPKPKTA